MPTHTIEKRRLDTRKRLLTVSWTQAVTPHLLRVHFTCDDLDGFTSPSPDDHIKIFIPLPDGEVAGRDFTPRTFSVADGTLTLEFALHETGPAADWARAAVPGAQLAFGGPRGTTVVPDNFDWYLLIGDTAALPSFARRIEELRPGVTVAAFIAVPGPEGQIDFQTQANLQSHWLQTESDLLTAAKRYSLPAGDGFIWVATETGISRDLYQHFTAALGHPAEWIKASGYWTRTDTTSAA